MTYESKYAVGDVVSYKDTLFIQNSIPKVNYARIVAVKFDDRAAYALSDCTELRGSRGNEERWVDEKYIIQKFVAVE